VLGHWLGRLSMVGDGLALQVARECAECCQAVVLMLSVSVFPEGPLQRVKHTCGMLRCHVCVGLQFICCLMCGYTLSAGLASLTTTALALGLHLCGWHSACWLIAVPAVL
jgi:hypothetical protein